MAEAWCCCRFSAGRRPTLIYSTTSKKCILALLLSSSPLRRSPSAYCPTSQPILSSCLPTGKLRTTKITIFTLGTVVRWWRRQTHEFEDVSSSPAEMPFNPPPRQTFRETVSQGKTSSGQGCQTDRSTQKPSSLVSSQGTSLEQCRRSRGQSAVFWHVCPQTHDATIDVPLFFFWNHFLNGRAP